MLAPAASAYTMHPGDHIEIQYTDGSRYGCTLNTVAHRGGARYGVTAGHCLMYSGSARPARIYGPDGRTVIASDMRDSGFQYQREPVRRDAAWFRLDPHVGYVNAVRGGNVDIPFIGAENFATMSSQAIYPNRPVASRQSAAQVRPGQIVCKDGGRSSRTCGPVLYVDRKKNEFAVLMVAIPGDSGSPVYTLGPDRRANVVGIASSTIGGIFAFVDATPGLPAGLR